MQQPLQSMQQSSHTGQQLSVHAAFSLFDFATTLVATTAPAVNTITAMLMIIFFIIEIN
ncbi:MAG TPA: hypothetical protein VI731_04190 [Bacteroidia bacterium]|nr:hypothetical protein [Bacteroidia bacterium]